MRVVVTGREGQVACALLAAGMMRDCEIVALGRPQLDLAADRQSVYKALASALPDVIVSAAAYTAVDRAESEPAQAFAVNATGAEAVALSAASLGVPLIHLSTDYVFDGAKGEPYVEVDVTEPRTVYGASKLAGEQLVLAAHRDCVILRPAWVFSPFGTNFVRTMLRLAGDRDTIGVVDDQFGSPTSASDLAEAILAIASRLRTCSDPELRGIFHLTNTGSASWADLAKTIFTVSQRAGGPEAAVRAISTSDYPTAAPRPANSRLNCGLVFDRFGISLRPWQYAVDAVVGQLVGSTV